MARFLGLPLLLVAGALLSLPAVAADGRPLLTSTSADRRDLGLTIYNDDLGLVKDVRAVTLPSGVSDLRFSDVAARVIPPSVQAGEAGQGLPFQVLEQNYEFDLLSPAKLLDKFVGKEVRLSTRNPANGREEEVTATLLSNNEGPVYRIGEQITFGHPGRVVFPRVPENLIAQPTLVWLLASPKAGERMVRATYLTGGIGWRADYVLTLNDRDDRGDLSAWVTITNRSGTSFDNARVKLVAGDVNRVAEDRAPVPGRAMMLAQTAVPEPPFTEQAFFEYHLYTLDRPATVKDNQTKQISLVAAAGVPVVKEHLFRGAPHWYQGRFPDAQADLKVGVVLSFFNREADQLGIPLPKGTVRVYKRDPEGSLQFVGEDAIDHTAKNERVRVRMGNAFDVVGSRRQTDWKQLERGRDGRVVTEAACEIVLRNHKKEPVTVRVSEPIPGDWTMISSSHEWKKADSSTAEWEIKVKPEGEARLVYTVRVKG